MHALPEVSLLLLHLDCALLGVGSGCLSCSRPLRLMGFLSHFVFLSGWKIPSLLGLHLAGCHPCPLHPPPGPWVFPGLDPGCHLTTLFEDTNCPSCFASCPPHFPASRLQGSSASAWNCVKVGPDLQSLTPMWLLMLPVFGIASCCLRLFAPCVLCQSLHAVANSDSPGK